MSRKRLTYVCDFETTSYEGQDHTEVWASAAVELGTEAVYIWNSINGLFNHFFKKRKNVLLLFHNLKFDGEFILHWLMQQGYTVAGKENEDGLTFTWKKDKDMLSNQYKYVISDMGQWYSILIKKQGYTIEIWDSLKIMPYSVKNIGKAFETKHRKSTIEYKGFRQAGGEISKQERDYIANDVLVVKEAIEYMYSAGHDKMTIGSCCLSEFKDIQKYYDDYFPDLTKVKIDPCFGATNADEYIRKEYGGGWCFNVPEKSNKRLGNGFTADVNSLYPSQMHSDGGRYYPVGFPRFFRGNQWNTEWVQNIVPRETSYYYIRIRCNFFLKKGKLPFIHIRNSFLYKSNENLKTNLLPLANGKYTSKYTDSNGEIHDVKAELTLSKTDYELFSEHYIIKDLEILDFCIFDAVKGLFDDYINKYRDLKVNAKTKGERTIAKLFLNNLYGKLAMSTKSDFKVAYIKPNGALGFKTYIANDKKAGHIAAGAAITSYARDFTIRAAQLNYHGGAPGFCYADTDSIHCDMALEELQGCTLHDSYFNAWKIESQWDMAVFVRQKTYIEHVTHSDGIELESPTFDIKCAGMSADCKTLFIESMTGERREDKEYTSHELEFLEKARTIEDFAVGLCVPGKLMAHRMRGGIVLEDSDFTMKRG